MKVKRFTVGKVLSVIIGKELIPGAISEVVSFLTGREIRSPSTMEIRSCRRALRKQFDFRERILRKELTDLELALRGVEDEEEVQKIIDNWVKEMRERFYRNKDFVVVKCFEGDQEKKSQFVPPY